jgi:hypothetical protein
MAAQVLVSIALAWPTSAATITTGLDVAGSRQTEIYRINDDGDMVGTYVDATGRHGFLRTEGADVPLDVPGAAWTIATGLTNRDSNGHITIVGRYWSHNRLQGFLAEYDPDNGATPFAYSSTGAAVRVHTMPWDINESKVVAGCTHSAGAADMLPWLLLGGSFLTARDLSSMYTGINGKGDVTGFWYEPSLAGGMSFVLKGQTAAWFKVPNSRHTHAYGINDTGCTVGFFWGVPGSPGMQAFLRHASGHTITFQVTDGSGRGAYMTHAYGINNSGVIVGAYQMVAGGPWHGFRRDP